MIFDVNYLNGGMGNYCADTFTITISLVLLILSSIFANVDLTVRTLNIDFQLYYIKNLIIINLI